MCADIDVNNNLFHAIFNLMYCNVEILRHFASKLNALVDNYCHVEIYQGIVILFGISPQ
jgi:hypothetical protein